MLITSNRSVVEWGTVFADPVVATETRSGPTQFADREPIDANIQDVQGCCSPVGEFATPLPKA
ncbi:hypothetical protein ABIA43_002127 [Bradyrhizobium sp. USDA 328]